MECPWHGMFLVPLQLGQGSSSHRELLTDLLRLCQGGSEERSWAGELCVPPPSPPASRAHSCSNTPWKEAKEFSYLGLLIWISSRSKESRSGSGVCPSSAVPGGSLAHGGWGSSCLCARKIILFM